MKVSRDQLKLLVKECLLELLTEGLGNVDVSAGKRVEPRILGTTSEVRTRNRPAFDPRLDTPATAVRSPTTALKDAIKREAGGNPIMESIFADTARTTLPTQMAHGDSGHGAAAGGLTQQEQFNGSPEQVFGEDTASRWANLAFMDTPAKKTA